MHGDMTVTAQDYIINGKLKIFVKGEEIKDEVFKTIGARKTRGGWLMPNLMASVEILRREFGEDLRLQGTLAERSKGTGFPISPAPLHRLPDETRKIALKWQIEGMDYLCSTPHRGGLLALSPGLGKTFTAICSAHILRLKNVLVICPKNLMMNWKMELRQWVQTESIIAYRQGPPNFSNDFNMPNWVITNYNTPIDFFDQYNNYWDLIILDESILLQNRKSDRTEKLTELCEKATRVWELSGFPSSKYNDRLYSQLRILKPDAFTSYWRFAYTYCKVEETKWGTKILGDKTEIDIQNEFRDLIFVRNHKTTLPDLPKIIYQNISVAMNKDQYDAYVSMAENLIAEWEGNTVEVSTKLASLMKLQQITSNLRNLGPEWLDSSGKTDTLLQLIEAFEIPLPTVIWVHWKATANMIITKLSASHPDLNPLIYSGSQKARDQVIDDFKGGQSQVLVLSPGAGKYGFTFTHAKSMVYHDKTWSVDDYVQSLARIDGRIGLDHSPVVISLKCPNTTDDLIEAILRDKSRSIARLTSADLTTLLGGLRRDNRRD